MNLIESSKKLLSQLMEHTAKSKHLIAKSKALISHSNKLLIMPQSNKEETKKKSRKPRNTPIIKTK